MRSAVLLLAILVSAVPSATAWDLTHTHAGFGDAGLAAPSQPSRLHATFLGSGPLFQQPLSVHDKVTGALACAAGDVDADGHADLLVRTLDKAGKANVKALAGPGLGREIWSHPISVKALLNCAPDLGLDGVADPLLRLQGEVDQGATAVEAKSQVVLQTLDGATGGVSITRMATETGTGFAAGPPELQVAKDAATSLLPAAAGAVAELSTESSDVGLLGSIGAYDHEVQAQAAAHLKLLDEAGRVVGQVDIDTPDVDPLALAPIPTQGLPQVAALTSRALSQASDLSAQVPTVSLYNPDGTLVWAQDLAASTGVPALVPRAGDLDLDGMPDLVVATVQGTVDQVPASQLTAVSGLDGHVLFETAAQAGDMLALPLGAATATASGVQSNASAAANAAEATLAAPAALLQATQASADASITLTALDGAGQALWTSEAAAGSFVANQARDAFTNDLVGLTDLTGDGVADVATAVATADGLAVTAVDGATGKVAWTADLPGVSSILAVAQASPGNAAAGLATVAAAPSDLLAVGADGNLTVSVVHGLDGQVEWTAQAPADGALVSVRSAGDIDGDGQADLLLAMDDDVSATAGGASANVTVGLRVLSSLSGATLAGPQLDAGANATAAGAGLAFTVTPGPAFQGKVEASAPDKSAPGAGLGLVVCMLGLAFLLRRRA